MLKGSDGFRQRFESDVQGVGGRIRLFADMKTNRDEDLMAVALALERLALEIRELVEEPEPSNPRRGQGNVPTEGRADAEIRVGQKVRITIADRYRGRYGVVVSARGTQYWDIRLDPLDGGVSQVIYKKSTSFVVVNETE